MGQPGTGVDWSDGRTQRALADAASAALALARADALAQRALVIPGRRQPLSATPVLALAECLAAIVPERSGVSATDLALDELTPHDSPGTDPLARHGLAAVARAGAARRWVELPGLATGDRAAAVETLERPDLPALARTALAFATLHHDASERARSTAEQRIDARVDVAGMLRLAGVVTAATPTSIGLALHRHHVDEALRSFADGDPVPVLTAFGHVAARTAEETTRLLDDVAERCLDWTALDARSDSLAWRVLPGLLTTPAVTVAHLISRLDTTAPTAMRAITTLEQAGILRYQGVTQRHRTWIAPAVVEALDAVARRTAAAAGARAVRGPAGRTGGARR